MFNTLDLRDKVVLVLLLLFYVFAFTQITPSEFGKNTWAQRRGHQSKPKMTQQMSKQKPVKSEPNPAQPEKPTPTEKFLETTPTPTPEKSKPIAEQPKAQVKPTPKQDSKPAPKIDNSFVQANPIRSKETSESDKPSLVVPASFEISGVSGKVKVNNQPVYSTSDFGKILTKLTSIITESDSWIVISTGNKGELVVFPNTEIVINGQTVELKEGKVLNRSSYFTKHKIDAITVNSSESKPEFVYFTEPGKARIFALTSDISITGFGKTTKVKKAFGTSVFILNKQINLYNLKTPVSGISISGSQVSWKANAESTNYYILSKHILGNKAMWQLTSTSSTSATLSGDLDEVRVYYENNFSTWSQPAIK
ncbi:hypothetical protein EP331_10895 [bacterium]|nr:MAG: hypothetical protein EP331_10895 [bacterium]